MREQQNYRAAIYCRLSSEDGADHESMSIGNQRALLTEYVQKQGWEVVDTYIDDGFSGTNFDRPGFQRMIADIEKGRINLVITKDDCVIIERKYRKPRKMRGLWCPFCFLIQNKVTAGLLPQPIHIMPPHYKGA